MRLLGITDLHGDYSALERILEDAGAVDLILLGGDITDFGTPNTAESMVQRAQQACPSVLAVAGNCDSEAIDQRLTELGVSLFRRGVVQQGIGFYGASAMPPWYGTMYELSEADLDSALRGGREQLGVSCREVVLSHTPPRDTSLDRTHRGEHVGSLAVRQFIEEVRPCLVVSGHIHEARGVEMLGPTTLVNCGHALHGRYALIELDENVHVDLRAAK
jgi:uncharacterized protein